MTTATIAPRPGLRERLHQGIFDRLYARSLLYNACWEDPACDRQALQLGPKDRVLVITSGGCNALDYALCAPAAVHAVDSNPRQGALLDLKLAGIRALDHGDFFKCFGDGRHPGFDDLYRLRLRHQLQPASREFWDERGNWFSGRGWRDSFYFHGLSGLVARLVRSWMRVRPKLRAAIADLLDSSDLAQQREIFDHRVEPLLWTPILRWAVSRQATMSLLGVPPAQTREVALQAADAADEAHAGNAPDTVLVAKGEHGDIAAAGVAAFIRQALRSVFRELPVRTNYFWTCYLRGRYTAECCPEYLTPVGFAALKGGLVDRVHVHTGTVTGFLKQAEQPITRAVLLDHQDWLAQHRLADLAEEWDWLLRRCGAGSRIIFRTARARATYLDDLRLGDGGLLGERLAFDRELARRLHAQDRVGTYGGFHIATPVAA